MTVGGATPAPVLDEWLAADFGVRAAEVVPVEAGADRDATTWRVRDESGARYAIKWTAGGSTAGLSLARVLAGIDGVVAPLPTRDGRPWSERAGRRLVVLPWIDATPGWEADLEDAHWSALGRLLSRVHATPARSVPDLPAVAGRHRRVRDSVAAMQGALERLGGPAAEAATDDLVRGVLADTGLLRPVVDALLDGADRLLTARAAGPGPGAGHVICHADVHLGNVLAGDAGRVWLLDWDDAVVAAPEQDLMFVLDGGVLPFAPVAPAASTAFLDGYGDVAIDPARLAYHRSLRALEDLVDFAVEVLAPNRHDRLTREASARILRRNLTAGGLTEVALRSLRDVGALSRVPHLPPAQP